MPDHEIERRCLPASEIRLDAAGDSPKIIGTAAVFSEWTDIGGMFRERILPGAFKKTIKEADVRALWNHDPNYVLGRNKSGTLRLKEDKKGLQVEIDPLDANWSNDLMKSMSRGDVSQMSFGFQVVKSNDDYNDDTRELVEVRLFDVSIVTYPAYASTTAEVRSAFKKEDPPPDEWEKLDEITRKLKAGEVLTEEETAILRSYITDPVEPTDSHSPTDDEPVMDHSLTAWAQRQTLINAASFELQTGGYV